jgi:hypothetical protein
MRTIGEIQAVVHEALTEGSVDAISGLSTAELCMCVESQRIMAESLRTALEVLISAIHASDVGSDLEEQADLAWEVCDQVVVAPERTPEGWLRDPETGDLC